MSRACQLPGASAEPEVRDTGAGIPAQELPCLFDGSTASERTRTTHEEVGSGWHWCRNSFGTVVLLVLKRSREGTTLVVTLPLGSAHLPPEQIGGRRTLVPTSVGATPFVEEALRWLPDAGQAEGDLAGSLLAHESLSVPSSSMEPGANGSRPHILLADDNADMRQYLTRLLAERYSVQATADGEAALAAACERLRTWSSRRDDAGSAGSNYAGVRANRAPSIPSSCASPCGEESRMKEWMLVRTTTSSAFQRVTHGWVGAHLAMARMRREAGQALSQSEANYRS